METHIITSPLPSTMHPIHPDLEALKMRQQVVWAAGDYAQIGVRLQIVGEALCEAVDLLATEKVLDVASGNGNASLAAARRFADVTSTDYVPALLDQGRQRAKASQLPIEFVTADAENLPFADASFDVVLSTFGVMFSPDQDRASSEMLRVVKPGGRIGLASWTPDGFIGEMFKVNSAFVPPPPRVRSPLAWGTETRLVELFGPWATDIRVERKNYAFRYASAAHFIEVFRTYYGPTLKAFAALDHLRQLELHAALLELLTQRNRSGGEALDIPSEYQEVVNTR
ncbi:MAG: class I SAM-dependent methyltransferase [Coriobacteriia bacterium]